MIIDLSVVFSISAVNLLIGLCVGFVMHRSDFCVAGMFRDFFLFRSRFMLRTLLLLVVCSMAFFEIARQANLLRYYPFPLIGSPSLANFIGGMIFGIGMVLAGGCVVGTLYKMGGGSFLSALAFMGLLVGSGIYAEIHPYWAVFAKKTSFLQGTITLPQLLDVNPAIFVVATVIAATFLFYRWQEQCALVRVSYAVGYLQPWKAAVLLALLGTISYVFVGMPLGVTTSYAKMAAFIENIFWAEHLKSVAYFAAYPLQYTDPLTDSSLRGGAGPQIDAIALIQFPLVFGIIAGSTISAVSLREFAVRFSVPRRQMFFSVIGGILLALASRTAPACNVWHLLGGLPILALQSMLFLLGLFPGAWLGTRILTKVVLR
jgi:uncharacterized membrane protein YedE/YeeE